MNSEMVDPLNPSTSYVQDPNSMVSDPVSYTDDTNSTSSCNMECNYEEQFQPKKNKKGRKKISRMIKYVAGPFSFVKKLKKSKKSYKQRSNNNDNDNNDNNNNDKNSSTTTTIHKPNSHGDSSYRNRDTPSIHNGSSSPFPSYNPMTSSIEDDVEANEESIAMSSSTKRFFGFVGMHHVMLMIILTALVVSGKACAIFATIVWLILLPLTSRFSKLGRRNDGRALMVRNFMAGF